MFKFLSALLLLLFALPPRAWASDNPNGGSWCTKPGNEMTVYNAPAKTTKKFPDKCASATTLKEATCDKAFSKPNDPYVNKPCPSGTSCSATNGEAKCIAGGVSETINCFNDTDPAEDRKIPGSLEIQLSSPSNNQTVTKYDQCIPSNPKKVLQFDCVTNTSGGDLNAYVEKAKVETPCQGNETCTEGKCQEGKAEVVAAECPQCPAGQTCNQTTGTCEAVPPAGCVADDGDPCTIDSCRKGKPFHQPILFDDKNPCTNDACQNGHELHTKVPNGTSCSDGNACNGNETCQSGSCTAGNPLLCPNKGSSECTVNTCDPKLGCIPIAKVDGTVCGGNKGAACKGDGFFCQAGSCKYVVPPQCDDKNPCTVDGCQPNSGCDHKPAGGATCNDNNVCTTNDVCSNNGSCVGSAKCPEGNTCNPTTGECKQPDQDEPLPTVSKIGVGGYRACWVKTDGTVRCAGNNSKGQSGQAGGGRLVCLSIQGGRWARQSQVTSRNSPP